MRAGSAEEREEREAIADERAGGEIGVDREEEGCVWCGEASAVFLRIQDFKKQGRSCFFCS